MALDSIQIESLEMSKTEKNLFVNRYFVNHTGIIVVRFFGGEAKLFGGKLPPHPPLDETLMTKMWMDAHWHTPQNLIYPVVRLLMMFILTWQSHFILFSHNFFHLLSSLSHSDLTVCCPRSLYSVGAMYLSVANLPRSER